MPGAAMRVSCGGRSIALVRTAGGELYAVDDTCTHEEASLAINDLQRYTSHGTPHHGLTFPQRPRLGIRIHQN